MTTAMTASSCSRPGFQRPQRWLNPYMELRSITYALVKFRVHLLGNEPFVVYTDHESLRNAINSPHLLPLMSWWLTFIFELSTGRGIRISWMKRYRADQTTRNDTMKTCIVLKHELSRQHWHPGWPCAKHSVLRYKGELHAGRTVSSAYGSLRWTKS